MEEATGAIALLLSPMELSALDVSYVPTITWRRVEGIKLKYCGIILVALPAGNQTTFDP
jgi:hypothetical protein